MKGIDVNAIPTADELQEMFVSGARSGIDELEERYRAATGGTVAWPEAIARMRAITHDIKGQGGSFGYPLITQVGESLSVLLKHEGVETPRGKKLIGAHIDALNTILSKQVQGGGGGVGRVLATRLKSLVEAL